MSNADVSERDVKVRWMYFRDGEVLSDPRGAFLSQQCFNDAMKARLSHRSLFSVEEKA